MVFSTVYLEFGLGIWVLEFGSWYLKNVGTNGGKPKRLITNFPV
jgi:hypothetical protein